MGKAVYIMLALVFSLLTVFPGVQESLASAPGCTEKERKDKDYSSYETIALGTIRQNPLNFRHRKVMVAGVFRGWQGKGLEHPGITRSDWVVEDTSGAIYVAGAPPFALDPVKDLGQPITVWGTLELTKKGIPYLVPHKVETGKRQ